MASSFQQSTCRGCGRPIVWAVNPATGKKVPLDPAALIYSVFEGKGGATECCRADAEEGTELMVTHFATCSKPNQFSGGGGGNA